MLKLAKSAKGHFVMLIEIVVHLIRVNPSQLVLCLSSVPFSQNASERNHKPKHKEMDTF